jgi:hypothetical protein
LRKIKVGFFGKRIIKKSMYQMNWNIIFKTAKNVLNFFQKGLTNMGVILSLSKVLKSTSSLPMTL